MDFLKIDLDEHNQPALARLTDIQLGETSITEARFNKSGVTITRFGSDKKPKQYHLNWIEMLALKKAAETYCKAIEAHAVAEEAHREAVIAEAKTLAKSIHFDLDTLNIRAKRDNERWTITVPAIGYEMYNIHFSDLKNAVQEAFDRIEHDVISAETWHWTSNAWPEIIASYRRAFPLEPEAIQQARALLKEAGLTGWVLTHCHPEPEADCWSFALNPEDQDSFALIDKPATEMLNLLSAYLIDMQAKQGESSEQDDGKFTTQHMRGTGWIFKQAPESATAALPE